MRKYCLAIAFGLSLWSIFSPKSFAECSGSVNLPGQQVSVEFNKNETSPSTGEAEKLKAWAKQMNEKYPIHQWLSIGAKAQPDEDHPDDLAISRAISLAKLALDYGLVRAPIELKSHVGSFGNPASYGGDWRTATLQLTPGCPNNCCDSK
ncbi:hypothetical protein [Burkholderia sp. Ac-20353]|uniref:hypothetical protein n=1 Tax=Burkholderia sp. Ac-20353 TaxID=2703894 RepID=UPI00197B71D8|nr:hypothetical protein [Burkholderia sp. Ac-20353]MBN3786809.1 hypothetical protein [Burkholderia sp. Ac-20353]